MNIVNECSSTCFYVNRHQTRNQPPHRKPFKISTILPLNQIHGSHVGTAECEWNFFEFCCSWVYRKICRNRRNQLRYIYLRKFCVNTSMLNGLCVRVQIYSTESLFFFRGKQEKTLAMAAGFLYFLQTWIRPSNPWDLVQWQGNKNDSTKCWMCVRVYAFAYIIMWTAFALAKRTENCF